MLELRVKPSLPASATLMVSGVGVKCQGLGLSVFRLEDASCKGGDRLVSQASKLFT